MVRILVNYIYISSVGIAWECAFDVVLSPDYVFGSYKSTMLPLKLVFLIGCEVEVFVKVCLKISDLYLFIQLRNVLLILDYIIILLNPQYLDFKCIALSILFQYLDFLKEKRIQPCMRKTITRQFYFIFYSQRWHSFKTV